MNLSTEKKSSAVILCTIVFCVFCYFIDKPVFNNMDYKENYYTAKENKLEDIKVILNSASEVQVRKVDLKKVNVLEYPVSGRISSVFGMRKEEQSDGTFIEKMHQGVDLAVPMSTPVHAALGGVIIYASSEEGYGNVIRIKHENNLTTVYAHCSLIEVRVGDYVNKGDEIGKTGSTGKSTGPHVHFEVRVNGNAVNPMNYL